MNRNEYNTLLAEAKKLGIKGYGQMKMDVLMDAIQSAQRIAWQREHETQRNAESLAREERMRRRQQEPVLADEVQAYKRFEYISADNLHVQFRAAQDIVTVYWGDDYKMHINSGRKGDRLTSYATLVQMFKPFTNGVDGDVARIVKALVRIKQLPAALKVRQHQSADGAGRRTPKRGSVDPHIMSAFVAAYADAFDIDTADVRNKHGHAIKHFFALNADELELYDADEIIYNHIACLVNMSDAQ